MSETLVPTVPDLDSHQHWFFSYVLYFGGVIHFLLSVTMVAFFFALNAQDFSLPDPKSALIKFFYLYVQLMCIIKMHRYLCSFEYRYMADKGKPTDYFKEQKSPKYFKMSFLFVSFKLLYVIVSDVEWK